MTGKEFGAFITKLIEKTDLTRNQVTDCMVDIMRNVQNDMQTGAFLAALTAKGETAEEIAAIWQVICELDTAMVDICAEQPVVENSGTGMDAFKTFNISTAASIIAAAGGVPMAKHGSRAITSHCGAVDIAEELGVNVECPPETVKRSIETVGIGIFNGTSPLVHPRALGRILSQISFGSVLNIAASLANPARPELAVRGVYRRDLLIPTAEAMREIGFVRALVVYGECEDGAMPGIDEASTMGDTYVCELTPDGSIREYRIDPGMFGIKLSERIYLAMDKDRATEARRLQELLVGRDIRQRIEIACLNAGLIFYVSGVQESINDGYEYALDLVGTDKPINKLRDWVYTQQ